MFKKFSKNHKSSHYIDNRWTTWRELRREKRFGYCPFKKLKKCKKDGILINSYLIKNKHYINMYRPKQTLFFYNDEMDMNKRYINSTLELLSTTLSKPSFVVIDNSGEYYSKSADKLKNEGYDVKVLDLNNPSQSIKWNPLDSAFVCYQKAHNLENQVETFIDVKPSPKKYKLIAKEYGDKWYAFDGVAYSTFESVNNAVREERTKLYKLAKEQLHQIAKTLCSVYTDSDSALVCEAQNFIYNVMLDMLEDSIKIESSITRDNFNLDNLFKICTAKNHGISKSVMDIVTGVFGLFQDDGMRFITCQSQINFEDFFTKPTALFIKMSSDTSRNAIVTMCLYQLYSSLISEFNPFNKLKNSRNVYFLLDDFTSLPMIDKFEVFLTLGRSRCVISVLFIKYLYKLNEKYDDETIKCILGNCNIQIFTVSDDTKTKEYFSGLCGDVYYFNNDFDLGYRTSRPLIYPDELGHIPHESVVVKIFSEYPLRAKLD